MFQRKSEEVKSLKTVKESDGANIILVNLISFIKVPWQVD